MLEVETIVAHVFLGKEMLKANIGVAYVAEIQCSIEATPATVP